MVVDPQLKGTGFVKGTGFSPYIMFSIAAGL
jgi:hypothetical protein